MRWVPILGVLAACGGGGGDDERPDGRDLDAPLPVDGWFDAAPILGGPVQETAVVALDGTIYVLGGFRGGEITDAVRVLETPSGPWRDGPTLPAPAHHLTATVVGDTLYVLGMLQGLSFTASGRSWAFTPGIDTTWRERAPMPEGLERGAAVAGQVGPEIVVAGGFGAVATVTAYDPEADSWRPLRDLPEARDHACGGARDGVLYVVGGRVGGTNDVRDTLLAFDGAWTTRATMPTGRGGVGCGFVGDELIVVGGEGNPDSPSGVFPQAEAYSIGADSWRTLAPMPHPRHGMGAAGWDGKLYVPGGADVAGFGAVDTFEILTP